MYTFVDGDFPIYGVLPDRPLSANVIVTRQKVPDQLDDVGKYCNYPKTQAGWSAQRSNPQQCTWSAPIKWAVYFRRTSYTYQGKQVIYAGFSETLDSGSTGACEEWWFAEGVGPLYIAAYPLKNWSDCKKVLAATSKGGLVDNPPLHFQKRKASLRGWLELVESCLGITCKVDI